MEIDKSKLTPLGSMNYILQITTWEDGTIEVDNYRPRKNNVVKMEITEEELRPRVEETIERMKIAIKLFQEYLEGKRETVYYWELDKED